MECGDKSKKSKKPEKPGSCSPCCKGKCSLSKDVFELKEMVKTQNKRLNRLIKTMTLGCKADEEPKEMCCLNPYMKCLKPDILYHLGLDTDTTDFPQTFGDVRFICMGGTQQRMEKFANFIMKEIGLKMHPGAKLKDLAEDGHRYSMYKVGPVLVASHGMGGPSISILLHELIKLVSHAKCQDVTFFRLGTSGGIGIDPGTVVITSEALDGQLRNYHELIVQGKPVMRPAKLDSCLAGQLKSMSSSCDDGYDTVIGKTMCADDFYEGQSRLDGAFCHYTPESKDAFLEDLKCRGVTNIEMESTVFAAITHHAGIRAAIVTVALLNRKEGDQITASPEELQEWAERPQELVARYIRKVLYPDDSDDDGGEEEEEGTECQ